MSRDAGSGAGPSVAAGAFAAAPLDRDTIDVLVVGGGAVGLTSALLLARHGCRPVVVERHAGTAIHPRARGLNVRTMEIFRELGLERAIRAAGAAIAGNHLLLWVETLAGRELRRATLAVHATGGAEAHAWAAALGVGPHGATLVRPGRGRGVARRRSGRRARGRAGGRVRGAARRPHGAVGRRVVTSRRGAPRRHQRPGPGS